jgi:hypothetical protein
MAQRPKHLKRSDDFPKLTKKSHLVTSDRDPRQNCIAFAAGVKNKKYWPIFHPDFAWISGIPRVETVEAFVRFYETFGYVETGDGEYAEGFEKIAIYTNRGGKPTHASLQIGPDKWASKLGNSYDIEHATNAVSEGLYGAIVKFMARRKA